MPFFWCEPAVLGAVVVIRLTCHPGRIAGFNVKNFPVFPSGIDVGSGDGQTHGIAQPASDSNDQHGDGGAGTPTAGRVTIKEAVNERFAGIGKRRV